MRLSKVIKNKLPLFTHILALCLALALALPPLSPAAAPASQEPAGGAAKPKIGLVLSGGGALGFCHVGVLKVLAELNIPIDYIAGTSMGAIIGGLYASGMSAAEIEEAIIKVDWTKLFSDLPNREQLSIHQKNRDDGFDIKFQMGVKRGDISLPRGLIQGQKLSLIMTKLILNRAEITNFDQLPIPFRAVATDIETGQAVIIGQGNLATAMRASMSVPGIFPPVNMDGKLLVDGGMANNLPINVVREMGADIVIAVDIPTTLKTKTELKSLLDVIGQSISILIMRTSEAQLASLTKTDILIQPDLKEFSAYEFDKGPELMERGQAAARTAGPKMAHLALPGEAYGHHLARRNDKKTGSPIIQFIRIENGTKLTDKTLRAKIRIKPGQKLKIKELEEDIADIYSLGDFKRVDYRIVKEKGQTGLVIVAKSKYWGPNYLKFGVNLENDFSGNASYTLAGQMTMSEFNRWGGEWNFRVALGKTTGLTSEFYQPIGYKRHFFVAPFFKYKTEYLDFYEEGDRISEYRLRQTDLGLAVGTEITRSSQLRTGVVWSWGSTSKRAGTGGDYEESGLTEGRYFIQYRLDNLNSVNWPQSGARGSVAWLHSSRSLGSSQDYTLFPGNFNYARSFGRNTFILGGEAGLSFGDIIPTRSQFRLGGLFSLSGYHSDELINKQAAMARLIYYRQVAKIGAQSIKLPVYLGGSLEAGNVWTDRDDLSFSDLKYSASVFIGTDTTIGPIYLAYGHGGSGRNQFYFYLGNPF